jgi:hypothetical protein
MRFRAIILGLASLFSASMTFAAAPVPESAKGVAIPQDKGYVVEEVKDGLYWVTEGAYTAMFLTTGKGVIVVDAPPSKNRLPMLFTVMRMLTILVVQACTPKQQNILPTLKPKSVCSG